HAHHLIVELERNSDGGTDRSEVVERSTIRPGAVIIDGCRLTGLQSFSDHAGFVIRPKVVPCILLVKPGADLESHARFARFCEVYAAVRRTDQRFGSR